MVDELPEPLATLKREHDNEKEKLFNLKEEIKVLKNTQYDFRGQCQRVRDIFSCIGSELLLHIRKEEQVLFPVMRGQEYEIAELFHFVMEHQELERMTREIHGLIDTLTETEKRDKIRGQLVSELSSKVKLFNYFLIHHIDMEERVLFPMALETMSEAELSYSYRIIEMLETLLSKPKKR